MLALWARFTLIVDVLSETWIALTNLYPVVCHMGWRRHVPLDMQENLDMQLTIETHEFEESATTPTHGSNAFIASGRRHPKCHLRTLAVKTVQVQLWGEQMHYKRPAVQKKNAGVNFLHGLCEM